MKFSLLVLSSPYSSQSHLSALKFAQACIEQQHQIYRIFFYHDGVHGGSDLQAPPQDEPHLAQQWQQLANEHNIDLVTCIAAALKRGILNEEEANRYNKANFNLSKPFELSGLGQLLDAQIHSDRLVTFG
ncbi:MAG: sulfurtransferase complex subunit TusD [Gammaproteobacteria bacterium]|nr:sulfurtransferase complex subunit TusD [Gammaproteobacteria bacterium]